MSLRWLVSACQRYRVPLLVLSALCALPFYLAFFYRVLGAFGVVGCALPLSP